MSGAPDLDGVARRTGYAEAPLERMDAGGAEVGVANEPYKRMDLVRRMLDGPAGVG